jgi:hypothetical protein
MVAQNKLECWSTTSFFASNPNFLSKIRQMVVQNKLECLSMTLIFLVSLILKVMPG